MNKTSETDNVAQQTLWGSSRSRLDLLFNTIACIALSLTTLAVSRYYLRLSGTNFCFHHSDDANYYLKIALNLSRAQPFTFDGLVPTNGFHPLWVIVLQPFCWFATSPEALTRAVYVFQYLMFIGCGLVLYFLLLQITQGRRVTSLLISLYFLVDKYFYKIIINGLETTIFVFLCLACLLYFFKYHLRFQSSPKLLIPGATLVSLLALSRLDGGGFHALGISVAFILAGGMGVGLKRLLFPATVAAAPVVAYLALSWSYTGALLPVSGMVKRANAGVYPTTELNLAAFLDFPNLYNYDYFPLLLAQHLPLERLISLLGSGTKSAYVESPTHLIFGGLATAFTFSCYFLLRRRNRKNDPSAVPYLTWFAVMAFALVYFNKYTYRFWSGSLANWYFISFSVSQLLLWGYILSKITLKEGLLLARIGAAVVALAFVAKSYTFHKATKYYFRESSDYVHWYESAKWIDSHLPQDARLAAYNAGIIGLFSNRHVMNLDGLVNSPEFFRSVLLREINDPSCGKKPMLEFMQRHGIQYFADTRPDADPDYYRRGFADPLFPIAIEEIYRSDPLNGFVSIVCQLHYPNRSVETQPTVHRLP